CEWLLGEPREIVLVGDRDDAGTQALLRTLHSRFVPNRVIMLLDSPETRRALAAGIPSIEFMEKTGGRASAYVCRNYTCQLPATESEKLAELIQ
ncbi:MAG: thioredoxin domain-containing protein, partial [Bryobacteraceae bacterium]